MGSRQVRGGFATSLGRVRDLFVTSSGCVQNLFGTCSPIGVPTGRKKIAAAAANPGSPTEALMVALLQNSKKNVSNDDKIQKY